MQDNQEQEYDFEGTGAAQASKYKWMKLELVGEDSATKECQLRVGGKDGRRETAWIGYLVDFQAPEWRPAHGRVPAHYEYRMIIKSKDPDDNTVREFCLPLSSHWSSPIVSDIINQLAGAMAVQMWNKKFRINVYAKTTKSKTDRVMRARLYDANQANGKDLPCKYPWVGDKDNGSFEGVPKPGTKSDGTADFSTISDFWHNECILLAKLFGNDTTLSVPPKGEGTTGMANPAATNGTPPVAQGQPEGLPARTMKWLATAWSNTPLPEQNTDAFAAIVKAAFGKLKAQNPLNGDVIDTLALVNAFAGKEMIAIPNNKAFNKNGELTDIVGAPMGSFDDLPF